MCTTPPARAFSSFDETFSTCLADANEFYERITPPTLSEDQRRVHRQALAGMLWSKQYYYFDLDTWLEEHEAHPMLGGTARHARNAEWFHMLNNDIISMPDKWEYPWYAAWDLAFHTLALSQVDFDFAKDQLLLMLRTLYSHPNGQIPAYEWNFSDVNPPVHAWATLFLFNVERELGRADLRFLERSFQGLMLNFNWWVNRKDPSGKNVFAGGFLGLDNIGVFDRSAQLPTGGHLDQADGTAWMAFYCQNMLEIALILAEQDPIYEDVAYRFLEHFIWITYAMDRIGDQRDEMWDEEDGFFYDLLHLPDGRAIRLKVRSMVGLLPLCASTVLEEGRAKNLPRLLELIALFRKRHPEMLKHIAPADDRFIGYKGRRLLSVCNKKKTERILAYMLDEKEFLSPYGIRSLSRYHLEHPFVFHHGGQEFRVQYLPAESNNGMFGGNSNWRGPIWMPVNGLLIRALMNLYQFYGDDFKVECPTGSGKYMTLYEVAEELGRRLSRIFLRDESGQRPLYGGTRKLQEDPHWKDYIMFYEYFHGDNGAGLGASHQTGWTGLIARSLDLFARGNAATWLAGSRSEIMARMTRESVAGACSRASGRSLLERFDFRPRQQPPSCRSPDCQWRSARSSANQLESHRRSAQASACAVTTGQGLPPSCSALRRASPKPRRREAPALHGTEKRSGLTAGPGVHKIGQPMHHRVSIPIILCLALLGTIGASLHAQRAGSFRGSTDDPAIRYSTTALNNAVVEANRKIQDGTIQLTFEGRSGYLRSALDALQIPVDSQLLVFSRASLQGKLINEQNPRALFFNDRVALGWVRGGEIIEVAAHDESAGVVFYTLDQRPMPRPPGRSSSGHSSASGVTSRAIRSACPAS